MQPNDRRPALVFKIAVNALYVLSIDTRCFLLFLEGKYPFVAFHVAKSAR